MRYIQSFLLALCLVSVVACETAKRVAAAAPGLISQIAHAYGSDYAAAIDIFAQAISPTKTTGVARGLDNMADVKLTAQVDVVRQGTVNQQFIAVPVGDGDVMTDNDNYKINIGCSIECYAYVAQLDATGKMDPILPSNLVALKNPLKGDQSYSIPAGNNWFFLDDNVGLEQIYFIFSKTPRPDIENVFRQISTQNESLTQHALISISEPMLFERGIGGVRQGPQQTVQFKNGQQGQYQSTVLDAIGSELVLTRYFDHRKADARVGT